jgi:hypothetical protein
VIFYNFLRWAKARKGSGERLSPIRGTVLGFGSPGGTENVNFCKMLEIIKKTEVLAKGSPGQRRLPNIVGNIQEIYNEIFYSWRKLAIASLSFTRSERKKPLIV